MNRKLRKTSENIFNCTLNHAERMPKWKIHFTFADSQFWKVLILKLLKTVLLATSPSCWLFFRLTYTMPYPWSNIICLASHHTGHFIWLSKVSWMIPSCAKGLGFPSTLIKRKILIRFHAINFTVWICREWSDQSLNDVIFVRSMQLPRKKMTRARNIFGRIGFIRGLM